MMQFVGQFPGEAEAEDAAGNPGYRCFNMTQIGGRVIQPGACQQLICQRPGDVDRPQPLGLQQNPHVQPPAFSPITHPHFGVAGAAAGKGEGVLGVAVFANHAVVKNIAALIEEEDVARTAVLDRTHLRRIQPLQQFQRIRPRDNHLAQGANIHNRNRFPHRPILRPHVTIVPRPPPAAAALHFRPQAAVFPVQRRASRGVMVRPGGNFAQR